MKKKSIMEYDAQRRHMSPDQDHVKASDLSHSSNIVAIIKQGSILKRKLSISKAEPIKF